MKIKQEQPYKAVKKDSSPRCSFVRMHKPFTTTTCPLPAALSSKREKCMEEEIVRDDPELSDIQKEIIGNLSAKQIVLIDEKLMEYACQNWRKVARIVMSAMGDLRENIKNIPDLYYGQRVQNLVEDGRLISQGNLKRMRYSEVKLP